MKILQLNIWGGRLGLNIKELLQRERSDIVCFQEAVKFPGGKSLFFEDLEKLQQDTGFDYCHFSPVIGCKIMRREAEFGLAAMSRVSFSHTRDVFLGSPYRADFDLLEGNVPTCLQHVVTEHNGKDFHILNHHGYHIPAHKDGDEETLRQCQLIVDYVEKLPGPVILCGDFNLKPDSESLELINAKLVNHAKERGVLTTRTPLTHKTEVCDYIFTSPDIEVKDFQVLDDIASDHKALTLEL